MERLWLFCAVYELQGEGLDGETRYFRKPWFMTMLMFMGMSLCLPLAYLEERAEASAPPADAAAGASEPLLEDGPAQGEQVGVFGSSSCTVHVHNHYCSGVQRATRHDLQGDAGW